MSNNYADETKPLFKLLKTEAFRFVIVRYNHYSFVSQLEEDIKRLFPDRPIQKMDAQTTTYQNISSTYFAHKRGFYFIEHFDILLKEERDSLNKETPPMKIENERRRHITAGLNLRRDKLAQFPIALFIFIPSTSGEFYAKTIMEKMPDLWSFRSFILDLEKEILVINNKNNINLQFNIATISGDINIIGGIKHNNSTNIDSKQDAELHRLLALLEKTPENEVAYRLTLYPQIVNIANEIGNYEQAFLNLDKWENYATSNDKLFIWIRKSDILVNIGNFHKAQMYIEKALKRFDKNKDRLNIAGCFGRLGSIHKDLGDFVEALSYYQKYHAICNEFYNTDRHNNFYKDHYANSCSRLGNLYKELGDLDKSQTFYSEHLKLSQELYITHPKNISYKESLAISYVEIGSLNEISNNLHKTLDFFIASNKLFLEIHNDNPNSVRDKNNLAISHCKLGEVYLKLGDLRLATINYNRYKTLCNSLVENSPTDVFFQNNYAESISIIVAIDKLLSFKLNTEDLLKARYIFNKLYEQTKNPKIKKKSAIVDKMLLPDSDLKQLILDISMF